MLKDKKYSKSSLEDFLRYMDGNLSDRERHRIERKLMKDPFEEEAMEGLSRKSTDEIREDIYMLDQQISKRVSRKRTFVWYRVAAIAVVLLAISITFVTVFDDKIGQLSRKVAETEGKSEELKMEDPVTQEARTVMPESIQENSDEPVDESEPPASIDEYIEEETAETAGFTEEEIVETAGITTEETAEVIVDEIFEESDIEIETLEDLALEAGETVMTEEAATREAPADMAAQPLAASNSRRMIMEAGENEPDAGQRTISGVVVSGEDDQPLRGVNIMVKGTNIGVVTDMRGNFTLPVNEESNNTLVANFIGMESKEVSIADQSEMEIILQPDQASLDEIVLVGYEAEESQPMGFREYIESNIRFPEDSELNRAAVILSFMIGLDGRPANITVLSSPVESFSREAIRLLNEGPDWNPALREGVPYEQSARVRIVFSKEKP